MCPWSASDELCAEMKGFLMWTIIMCLMHNVAGTKPGSCTMTVLYSMPHPMRHAQCMLCTPWVMYTYFCSNTNIFRVEDGVQVGAG